ncbi:hypothetical protein EN780_07860 [Mesorhizobium sp. M4B.F.Ca.ET.089.01.1.1]|uniref:hypothetical protein n=1 Tax=Mesorhizobium sp. M4B.F.Ca.ET.089.01.1.1 TaxID=2496662 RepID=UPI000FE4163E|nr:hypothetical protein [Mesorhizobium sp. M4B.F.Ca.ET.089.01.1.1]RWX68930.1 hypothetical protein EN780_07860 [Mesorhizobium sp. M4B.F.Ca.ET.089.01.1.1]
MSDFDPHLTIADLRVLYCVKGVKKQMDAAGLDFARFIKEGAKASELRGVGLDAQVDRAVEFVKARDAANG